jgi:ABC-type lipoprotein release transport system permease subunit
VGDKTTLMGREFTVSRCHEQRGNKDDITAWIPLHDAQDLLGQPGRINAILALECLCAGHDALARVRKDVTAILPDTQVVEVGSRVIARAEARYKLRDAAKATLAKEKATREALRAKRETRAKLITGIVLVACALWLAVLTAVNASQRRDENAVLRTFGLSTAKLLSLILGRSLFTALLGALLGIGLGGFAGRQFARLLDGTTVALPQPSAHVVWVALVATLVLALLAAWLPALAAVLRDPADELRER